MFNKFALVFMGLMVTVSSVGCCCFGGYPYNSSYRQGGCAPCNSCPPQGGGGGYYPPQQGAFYQGADPSQTAFATGSLSQTAYAPMQSSYSPIQSAALMPGAIQGPPIYNTAVVPTATLPMY